jgi:quinol monooxygenase YgiN
MKTVERNVGIISASKITVSPENRRELCLTISALLDPIRREKGCRAYSFYGEVEDQNSLMLIGEWDTFSAWDRHLNSEHFAVLIGSLQLLSNRSDIDFKLLSQVAGIEALTEVERKPQKEALYPVAIR